MDALRKGELSEIARQIRIGIIDAVYSANSGHPGGSLSIADVLAYLYFEEMNIDPANPKMETRDRLVLSKGHCAPGLYSALAQRGFIPVEDLKTFRKTNSYLQGHPDMKHTPGVDMSSGSLGQGTSVSCGMALAGKIDNAPYRVYAIIGDGGVTVKAGKSGLFIKPRFFIFCAAALALVIGIIAAWCGRSLLSVAVICCAVVFVTEFFLV